jgi:RNA polymerase sigma-B factor
MRAATGRQERTDALIARLHDPDRPLDAAERADLVNEVVTLNTPVAHRIARRFAGRGCSQDDLEQTACLALLQAVRRYDPATGHHFLSYVIPCITGEVKRHFRDQGWMVRPPRPVQELQSLVDREWRIVDAVSGRPPDEAGIAARLGVPVQDVHQAMLARGCFSPTSLEQRVAGSERIRLGDILVAPRTAQEYDAAEARAVLEPVLAGLDPTERRLLQLRFIDECSQRDIADELGISQSQVSRMLSSLLRRLRDAVDDAADDSADTSTDDSSLEVADPAA